MVDDKITIEITPEEKGALEEVLEDLESDVGGKNVTDLEEIVRDRVIGDIVTKAIDAGVAEEKVRPLLDTNEKFREIVDGLVAAAIRDEYSSPDFLDEVVDPDAIAAEFDGATEVLDPKEVLEGVDDSPPEEEPIFLEEDDDLGVPAKKDESPDPWWKAE